MYAYGTQAKIDKETCGKIIEAAETVKDGTKEVVKEVKRVGQAVTDKLVNATGNVCNFFLMCYLLSNIYDYALVRIERFDLCCILRVG